RLLAFSREAGSASARSRWSSSRRSGRRRRRGSSLRCQLEEGAQDALAVRGGRAVGLGVELRAPPAALLARDRLHAAAVGRGQQAEAVRQVDQLVDVVVPYARALAHVAEEPVALDDSHLELADLRLC